jgi:hypothetical protein
LGVLHPTCRLATSSEGFEKTFLPEANKIPRRLQQDKGAQRRLAVQNSGMTVELMMTPIVTRRVGESSRWTEVVWIKLLQL